MIGVPRQTLKVLVSRLERRALVKINFRRIQVIEQVRPVSPATRQAVQARSASGMRTWVRSPGLLALAV
jgi:hypothetical protein